MVWFNIKITEHFAKYTPLKAKEKEIVYCDSNGNKLNYIKGSVIKGYYTDDKGNKVDNVFIMKDNKPFTKYDKTKEVNKIKEVELQEVENLLTEKKYLMYSESLLKELKDKPNKAIKFLFSNGGNDFYYAYVYVSKLYNGFLFMELGKTFISDSVKPIIENMKEKKQAQQLNLSLQGVEKLNLNEIEL